MIKAILQRLILFVVLIVFLTGCVRYDVGVNFSQANKGTIIQHIKLGEQLTSFSEAEGNAWLNGIQKQALKLHGKVKRLSAEELVVTIPFNNGQDLVNKFNQFFLSGVDSKVNRDLTQNQGDSLLDLEASMDIKQSNGIFIERNVLHFSADLTPLGVVSDEGNIIISSGDLINLQLSFNFPWGAKLITNDFPTWTRGDDNQYNVSLKAGQVNDVTAIFWVPNYIGLGAGAIALFTLLGFILKYPKSLKSLKKVS
ncbi:hypothetical protein Cyast_2101 [Cyanobacterium stanieri PCC 7202]|uniref:DUF3153 domain-containing protein n=1 Tax=Cyanobacterium stanieri (strain ATCC 29140 / PCC 7202) TaxID=292563 RepID=K9YM84_CYASC|nr:hypothetical protein Cyast_2101 [Cyanobacterium stanieri PCC 7202]